MVFTDDSSKIQVKMQQVVHEVFKKYLVDKYSEDEIGEFIQLYIETLSISAQHDPLHFELNFHMTSKMMAPHLESLLGWPSELWELVLAKTSRKSGLESTLFCFGNICRKHFFPEEAERYFSYALKVPKDDYDSNDHSKTSFIATIINNQGLIFHESDEFDMARLYYTRALDTLRALYPPNTSQPEISDSLNKLGTQSTTRCLTGKLPIRNA